MKRSFPVLLAFLAAAFMSACGGVREYSVEEIYRVDAAEGARTVISVNIPASYGRQVIGGPEVGAEYELSAGDGFQTVTAVLTGGGELSISYTVSIYTGSRVWEGAAPDAAPYDAYLLGAEDIAGLIDSLEPGTDMAVALDINEYVFYSSAAHAWAKARDSGIPADELNEFFSGGRIMTDYISRAARRAAYENGTADASDLRIDSGDYADLMVSLLRAAGIPARTVCGLNLSTAMTPYSYTRAPLPHAWVEFYSGGWRGTDPYYGNAYMDNAYGNLLSYGTADRDVNSEARRETAAQMAGDGYALVANSGAPHNYMAFSQDAGAVVTLETDYKYR